ncbi:MAG: hypothetical protein QOF62_2802 [Pyrinomonadaceae bacterium]|jgi:hypothetical protein|nr:hypothetical protein [Pyrinomonadaceae bacterium]
MQVTPELSTDFDSQLITWGIACLAVFISVLSLLISGLTLLFQRLDKKPKLTIELERTSIYPSTIKQFPEGKAEPLPTFTIVARNSTDKTIKIRRTTFIDGKKRIFDLPRDWQQITEVPSHEMKTAVVSVRKFNAWAGLIKTSKPEKGYFLLTDHLDNNYKTPRLGDSLSLEPERL